MKRDKGTIVIGSSSSSPYTITLDYEVISDLVYLRVSSEPWAIFYVDRISRGKTPVEKVLVRADGMFLDFKRPGVEASATLILYPAHVPEDDVRWRLP